MVVGGVGALITSQWKDWSIIIGGIITLGLAMPSKRPDARIDMPLGKYLLTMALCAAPFAVLLVMVDSGKWREALIVALLVSTLYLPMLIHRKKFKTPPVQGSVT